MVLPFFIFIISLHTHAVSESNGQKCLNYMHTTYTKVGRKINELFMPSDLQIKQNSTY